MIYGIGMDIVLIERLTRLIERHGNKISEKILAPCEREAYQTAAHPARFLAKRFAAKEAVAKALGTGLRAPVVMSAFWVQHTILGQPFIQGNAEFLAFLAEKNLVLHLSISDEITLASAYAIAEILS
ncbi:MAG: holo-ACP synthase [Neisseriaceae bacterium]|nr:holo-ACP synthase [Neisseriaceae bacterium]